ncbi:hypothetical protein SAMN06298216_3372 [Spirosomataceae bacterium TFI 002]|nr:hypothetical protein SAMN06298216_3372 [Spirosomataceae bacterium TFI 002]
MKLKLVALLIIGSAIFASCQKKQCPAYGSVEKAKTEKVSV